MVDRYLLVRKDGQAVQIPAGDGVRLRGPINEAAIVPIASVNTGIGTLNLQAAGSANTFSVVSTQGAVGFNAVYGRCGVGARRKLIFGSQSTGQITLHGEFSTLVTPGNQNIVVREGDSCDLICLVGSSDGSVITETWKITAYERFDGTALAVKPVAMPIDVVTQSGEKVDLSSTSENVLANLTSTPVTQLGLAPVGSRRLVRFNAAGTLKGNYTDNFATSQIQMPGGDVAVLVNDAAEFLCIAESPTGYGRWLCVDYQRADGTALVATAAADATKLPLDGSKQMTGALNEAAVSTSNLTTDTLRVANQPANTIVVGPGGNSRITAIDAVANGAKRTLIFGYDLTMVHSATLKLPGQANIIARADDKAEFQCRTDSGQTVWECLWYTRKDGTPLVSPAAADPTKLPLAGGTMTGAINESAGTASTNAIPSSVVDASTTITLQTDRLTSIASAPLGARRTIRFGSRVTIVNSDSLLLFAGADITTAAGDFAEFYSYGLGMWQMMAYGRSDGTALVAPAVTTPAFRTETIATTSVGQTSYTVPNGYTAGSIMVWLNGVLQQAAEYTATNGTTVVLAVGATSTQDVLQVGVLSALRAQDDALLQYTVAGLPAASTNAFKMRWCTNMAGGAGVVVSNGTNWVRVADNTIVTV